VTDSPRFRTTRRGALAIAGSSLLAGCGGVGGLFSGSEPVVLDGTELKGIVDAGTPAIPERVPVEISDDYLADATARVETLLGSVPDPLGPGEIPNGAIREDLSKERENAKEALDRVENAATGYEKLQVLRDARRRARALAAGWEAIDAGLTREDVLASAPEVRDRIDEVGDRHGYVGNDPVRAVLAHAAIEGLLVSAKRSATVHREQLEGVPENPVTIGELAGDLEAASAAVAGAAHIYERFTDSLDGGRDLEAHLRSAGDALVEEIETRQGDLPSEDAVVSTVEGDLEDTPAGRALRNLHDDATYTSRITDAQRVGRLASAILQAQETLAGIGAFEAFRETVDGGEDFTVETVAEVRSIRKDAVDAIESARENGSNPRLTYAALEGMGGWIRFADDDLARAGDEVNARYLDNELAAYIRATYIARSIPEASETVADALAPG